MLMGHLYLNMAAKKMSGFLRCNIMLNMKFVKWMKS